MRDFLDLLCKSKTNAVLAAIVCLAVMPYFAPLYWFGAVIISLLTLRFGAKPGLSVMLISNAVIALVFVALFGKSHLLVSAFTTLFWIPAWLQAVVLNRTTSLAVGVISGVGFFITLLVVFYVWQYPPEAYWMGALDRIDWRVLGFTEAQMPSGETKANWANLLTVLFGSSLCLLYTVVLFIGRWLQAVAVNPGGFKAEFLGLSFGRTLGLIALALTFAGSTLQWYVFRDIGCLLLLLYLLQGASLFHAFVANIKLKAALTVVFYVALTVSPAIGGAIIMLGVLDNWFKFKQRLLSKAS